MVLSHIRTKESIFDFDGTLCLTASFVQSEYSWAKDHRGTDFYDELQRREGAAGIDQFLSLFNPSRIDPVVKKECLGVRSSILTAGLPIQLEKIARTGLLLPVYRVDHGSEKTFKLIQILRQKMLAGTLPDEIEVYEDQPQNIDVELLEGLFHIRVKLVYVQLFTHGGPVLSLLH